MNTENRAAAQAQVDAAATDARVVALTVPLLQLESLQSALGAAVQRLDYQVRESWNMMKALKRVTPATPPEEAADTLDYIREEAAKRLEWHAERDALLNLMMQIRVQI